MSLYVVSTPIGNLEDITLRALRILSEVDLIACEDTRHSRKLLTHYNIHKPLTSYYQHNQIVKSQYLIKLLKEGKDIALITDAGTPGISDPGFFIIREAIKNNVEITAIPGPSGLITALVSSGLPADGFVFSGFLPRKKGKMKKELIKLASPGKTIIIYESPFRTRKTVEIIKEVFGDCPVVIARELTKKFEEIIRASASEVIQALAERDVKGEVVILVKPELQ